jgi:hypothetical protein
MKETIMADPQNIADRYLACWNERDPARRRALIAALWTEGATYLDPLSHAEGHAAIAALIDGAQARFQDFRFAPAGRADGYADRVRFSWTLGPDGAEAPIAGTDVAVLAPDGRIASVTGFLDRVPG